MDMYLIPGWVDGGLGDGDAMGWSDDEGEGEGVQVEGLDLGILDG